jgi:hypothetical protein
MGTLVKEEFGRPNRENTMVCFRNRITLLLLTRLIFL